MELCLCLLHLPPSSFFIITHLSPPRSIFIIDHAWSYRAGEARQCLMEIPGLLERMVGLMDIPNEENTREEFVEKVMWEMWKYNGTYSIGKLCMEW